MHRRITRTSRISLLFNSQRCKTPYNTRNLPFGQPKTPQLLHVLRLGAGYHSDGKQTGKTTQNVMVFSSLFLRCSLSPEKAPSIHCKLQCLALRDHWLLEWVINCASPAPQAPGPLIQRFQGYHQTLKSQTPTSTPKRMLRLKPTVISLVPAEIAEYKHRCRLRELLDYYEECCLPLEDHFELSKMADPPTFSDIFSRASTPLTDGGRGVAPAPQENPVSSSSAQGSPLHPPADSGREGDNLLLAEQPHRRERRREAEHDRRQRFPRTISLCLRPRRVRSWTTLAGKPADDPGDSGLHNSPAACSAGAPELDSPSNDCNAERGDTTIFSEILAEELAKVRALGSTRQTAPQSPPSQQPVPLHAPFWECCAELTSEMQARDSGDSPGLELDSDANPSARWHTSSSGLSDDGMITAVLSSEVGPVQIPQAAGRRSDQLLGVARAEGRQKHPWHIAGKSSTVSCLSRGGWVVDASRGTSRTRRSHQVQHPPGLHPGSRFTMIFCPLQYSPERHSTYLKRATRAACKEHTRLPFDQLPCNIMERPGRVLACVVPGGGERPVRWDCRRLGSWVCTAVRRT